jgi:hypothetical protein
MIMTRVTIVGFVDYERSDIWTDRDLFPAVERGRYLELLCLSMANTSVRAACPLIPNRLRGVRAVRPNATARGWKKGSEVCALCNGLSVNRSRRDETCGGGVPNNLAADDRLIENADDVGKEQPAKTAWDVQGCICSTTGILFVLVPGFQLALG